VPFHALSELSAFPLFQCYWIQHSLPYVPRRRIPVRSTDTLRRPAASILVWFQIPNGGYAFVYGGCAVKETSSVYPVYILYIVSSLTGISKLLKEQMEQTGRLLYLAVCIYSS
jgi:hypothetical protein